MLGKLLGERYQVLEVLSQSLFCRTYLVKDTNFVDHPSCIVKHFLPSTQCSIPLEIRRRLFVREVEALKKLGKHDLIPYHLADFEDNLEFYLVQEFIEGHTLSKELPSGYKWCESKVFQLLQEVLSILKLVHDHGLIHRDVKPSNIIRRKQDNRLVLIDFGAVKPTLDQLVKHGHTLELTTIAIGTPGYMPNEQQRGRPRPNSDIYALGMIGIQALTGLHPTQLLEERNTGEVVWQHLAPVSTELASVLNKMVSYHSQDRYNSATEALKALLPLVNLYTQKDKLDPTLTSADVTLLFPASSSGQNNEPIAEGDNSTMLLNDEMKDTSIYTFHQKSPLLIGLVAGAISGLILMVVSYWSIQLISPVPKAQNYELQPHLGSGE
ncbi:MAG: serine/threonine-protein kinase [Rhizonema sp. PD37]|nr:serine/threonine-protein kinase [Rhizonema sp. PD37]